VRFVGLYKRATLIILRKVPADTLAQNPEELSRIVRKLSAQTRSDDPELRCLYFAVLARSFLKCCPTLSLGDLKQSLQRHLTNKALLPQLISAFETNPLMGRALLRVLAAGANILVPTTGLDSVKLLTHWYSAVNTTEIKSLKAFKTLVDVMQQLGSSKLLSI